MSVATSFDWGGKTWRYGQLQAFVNYLSTHGTKYVDWADKHPDAAAILTTSPTLLQEEGGGFTSTSSTTPAEIAAVQAAAAAALPALETPDAQSLAQPGDTTTQLVVTPSGNVVTTEVPTATLLAQLVTPPAPSSSTSSSSGATPASSTTPIAGDAAAAELYRLAELYNIDPLAAAANALNEGAGGGIGDGGVAYGPWQDHVTDGRLPQFATTDTYVESVQRWAWSPDGFAYAFRSMVNGGAAGLTGHDAVHAIVYGFEKPLDKEYAYTHRSTTYDELAALDDPRAAIAAAMVGVSGSVSVAPSTGNAGPGASASPVTRPARASTAWSAFYEKVTTGPQQTSDQVKSRADALVTIFGGRSSG